MVDVFGICLNVWHGFGMAWQFLLEWLGMIVRAFVSGYRSI